MFFFFLFLFFLSSEVEELEETDESEVSVDGSVDSELDLEDAEKLACDVDASGDGFLTFLDTV